VSFSANTFGFHVSGPESSYWGVYASTDLVQWQLIGGVTLSSAGAGTFSEGGQSGVAHRFYRLSQGEVCSKAVGFARVMVPAGNSFLANPFDLDGVNSAANILRLSPLSDDYAQPAGTMNAFGISIFNGSSFESVGYYESDFTANNTGGAITDGWATDGGGGAPATPPNLPPGVGFVIANQGNPVENIFMGTVMEGSLHNPIPAGTWLRSSMVPQAAPVDTLGLLVSNGDQVLRWTGGGYATYTYTGGAWSPSVPSLGIGESVFIHVATAKDWTRDFSACH